MSDRADSRIASTAAEGFDVTASGPADRRTSWAAARLPAAPGKAAGTALPVVAHAAAAAEKAATRNRPAKVMTDMADSNSL